MADDAPGGDPVQVAEAREIYEAELMALRLRANGIDAHVLDQTFHAEPLPSVRSFSVVRVMAPASQAAEARAILAEGRPLPDDAEPSGNPEVM
jgi:hypothetical protein